MEASPLRNALTEECGQEQAARVSVSQAPRGGVLVVDDEALIRSMLNTGLAQYGFEVRLAASGREAIEIYSRDFSEIDLVLLDVRMPGLDGPQTLARLEAINPNVRCCFMS